MSRVFTRSSFISRQYLQARQRYADIGVDTDSAIKTLLTISLSIHCWQGDDVSGFENSMGLSGGILATGNYPGKATTPHELRLDLERALSLVAGKHRVNLHAIYADTTTERPERNRLTSKHFAGWIDWAKERGLGLDFNPTFFSHPMAASGFTLSSADESIRRYWIEHGIACRRIGADFGKALKTPCITNFWIPDGYKDLCVGRMKHREILLDSLDKIFSISIDGKHNRDAIESKLFGIGSESYVTGSHEFYLGYALRRGKILCLDMGHFHPTESIADKISSLLLYFNELLLHVSRGIRWDSDHVVIFDDELRRVAEEIVRCNGLRRVHIALDYFDASINRIAAWVIGIRAVQKALLSALLQPLETLREAECRGDFTRRLSTLESLAAMPFNAVWNHFCEMNNVPIDGAWIEDVKQYESQVLVKRPSWSVALADEPNLLDQLSLVSCCLGLDNDYVQVGGGNTSVKSADRMRMYIKASGSGLAQVNRENGWVCVHLSQALGVLDEESLEGLPRDVREAEAKKRLLATVSHPSDRRPSVETFLHAMLDTVVMHSHPVAANALTCHPNPHPILDQLNSAIPYPALWVPYVDPGVKLAFHFRRFVRAYERRYGRLPTAVFLENHGFICTGPTAASAIETHLWWMNRLERYFEMTMRPRRVTASKDTATIARNLTRHYGTKLMVRAALHRELAAAAFNDMWRVLEGALTPDHIVYQGEGALCISPAGKALSDAEIQRAIRSYLQIHASYPRIIVVAGRGIFVAGETQAQLDATETMAVSALRIAMRTGGAYRFLPKEDVAFIVDWEVEKFRAGVLIKKSKEA